MDTCYLFRGVLIEEWCLLGCYAVKTSNLILIEGFPYSDLNPRVTGNSGAQNDHTLRLTADC
jgi:hypothetical protein